MSRRYTFRIPLKDLGTHVDDASTKPSQILIATLQQSTAHGLSKLTTSRGPVKRYLWSLAVVCIVLSFLINMTLIIMDFISFDVNVKVEIKNANQQPFPAVTVCNMNPIKASALGQNEALNNLLGKKKRRKRDHPRYNDLTCPASWGAVDASTGLCYFTLSHAGTTKYPLAYSNGMQYCRDSAESTKGGMAIFDSQQKIDFIKTSGINHITTDQLWMNLYGTSVSTLKYIGTVPINSWNLWQSTPDFTSSKYCTALNPSANYQWYTVACTTAILSVCMKKAACPLPLESLSFKCFFLWDQTAAYTWAEADNICQYVGAKRASLTTQEQIDHVKTNINFLNPSANKFWTSLKQLAGNQYKWNTYTGEEENVITSNWDAPSPLSSETQDYCVTANGASHQWASEDCNTDALVLCEWSHCSFGSCVRGSCSNPQPGQFYCTCPAGYTGTLCETDINECDTNPCQNGGTCTDAIATYTCACPQGYTGTDCQSDINECDSSPCLYGATCNNLVALYTCTCVIGYTGYNCEVDIDDCDSAPCLNGATCTDLVNDISCSCVPGFTGILCETNIDECASVPCLNDGTCIDQIDGYNCGCVSGYTGSMCETDIDECASVPCLNDGTCIDQIDGYNCGCVSGYTGSMCETDIDECASIPCDNDGTCMDFLESYNCTCQPGFNGTNCEFNIDECVSSPCLHGGLCVDLVNSYQCNCTEGWDGTNCQNNIDECGVNSCFNGGFCNDQIAAYNCTCLAGFEGDRCENETNECLSDPCQNGASCIDELNQYSCACVDGYNGTNCEIDIDECSSQPCQNEATCVDDINGYMCHCEDGYNGTHCHINIDECESIPCDNRASCTDLINGFNCSCVAGYIGTVCETDVDECSSSPCVNGAYCEDLINGYQCNCTDGYSGIHCEIDINECASVPCQNQGNCTDLINGHNCTCIAGFNGTHCETNIDECVSSPCFHDAYCVDLINSYQCICLNGSNGTHCEININECYSMPCQNAGVCTDLMDAYNCTCMPGYLGVHCEIDYNECESSPCLNGATCTDFPNSYNCTCVPGYNGTHCEIDIDECLSGPCHNEGVCIDDVNGFNCSCISGYDGILCENEINECSPSPCLNGGVCKDLINSYNCLCLVQFQGIHCETEIPQRLKKLEGSSVPGRVAQREDFVKQDKASSVIANLDQESKVQLGFKMSDMVLDCDFNGVACNVSELSQFYNPYHGNCYTFNSGWDTTQAIYKATDVGRKHGLRLTMNIVQDEYLDNMGDAAGAKVVVQTQGRMPFPEDEGIMIGTGFLTSIGLKKVSLSRQPYPYGECAEFDPIDLDVYSDLFPVNYSSMGCYKTCFQKYVIDECTCADPYLPMNGKSLGGKNSSACSPSNITQDDCKYVITEKYAKNKLGCSCPLPCVSNIYLPEVSKTQWPSDKSKSSALLKYGTLGQEMLKNDKYKKNLIKLEVYFKELSYEIISQVPSYSVGEFASDLGGVVSLWIAASSISLMEWFEVGLDMVILSMMKALVKLRKESNPPTRL